jgi:hypothetical protein
MSVMERQEPVRSRRSRDRSTTTYAVQHSLPRVRAHYGVAHCPAAKGDIMARYRVTLRVSSIEVVEANNP